ncbi:HK97 family phage major capsid protein [Mycoplasmopsis mustelae]|uniref:HK97 family phage major capsid protein n=1 Tax=Mycoplasmopsis mustelae TaxID=171289 RepID=A0A4R7UDJ6_9BACT|nr:phage major capsid protein [Mycoplasmopsis mustelae]TDV23500.1 HK97 family phage major capsid protein [Mycoplasmopsis mustelae]
MKPIIIITKNKPTTANNENKRTIELTIELDSWSPIYENYGTKYREQIAPNCFDFDTEISKQEINSYLDHKVSIEHLLASTKNKSMQVRKENNKIIANIPVDEANPLLKKAADLIADGVIESNSFIFQPLEVEVNKIKDNPELQLELTYTKAKLMSIDPVFEGFYPQDKCRVYDASNNENINILEYLQGVKMKQETSQEQKQPTPNNDTEIQALNEKIAELEAQVLNQQAQRDEMYEKLQKRFEAVKEQNEQPKAPQLSFKELRDKAKAGTATAQELAQLNNEMLDLLTEADKNEIRVAHPATYAKLQKRALDGTTNEKGLAVIETQSMPGILTDWNALFPEYTELASKFNLTGLDQLVKNVYVPDNSDISAINEGADSTALGGKTFQVKFSPVRYSTYITQNNALTHGAELWNAQVQNAKNSIIRALRKKFYESLFTHATATVPTNGTYSGGVTQEAKYTTKATGKFSWSDIDALVREIQDKGGDDKVKDFVIVMHPTTLAALEEPFINSTTASFINTVYDTINKTYRGLQIITTSMYPDNTIATNKKVAVLFDKNAVASYGLSFVVENDPYKDMSKDQINTYIRTRGEIKLVDPHVHSRFVVVK